MVTLRKRSRTQETPANPKQTQDHGSTPADEVSGYEEAREKRISENMERMQKLGILDLSLKLKPELIPLKRPGGGNSSYQRKTPKSSPLCPSLPPRDLSLECKEEKMALSITCPNKMMDSDINEGKKVYGVIRRMGSMGRKRVEPLCFYSPSKTPLKKPCRARRSSDMSMLERPPEDLLIRVLCGVEHEDLGRLLYVSKTIREATVIAKEWHFAFRTPQPKTASLGPFTPDENSFSNPEVPNAPKLRRCYKSQTRGRNLADITVALFHSMEE